MSKTLQWNMEDYAGMEDFIARALGEANYWANYKKTIDEYLPEWDEDCEDDRAEGLELVRQAVNIRAYLYRQRDARKQLDAEEDRIIALILKGSEDATDKDKLTEVRSQLEPIAYEIVRLSFSLILLRQKFKTFVEIQRLPIRARGRQPKEGALTTEDYS